MKYSFQIENLKCSGCTASITRALKNIQGVENVQVEKNAEQVIVSTTLTIERNLLVQTLADIGYPEKGNNSLLHKTKSVISCAIGKLTVDNTLQQNTI